MSGLAPVIRRLHGSGHDNRNLEDGRGQIRSPFRYAHRVLGHLTFVDRGVIGLSELASGRHKVELDLLALTGCRTLANFDPAGIDVLLAFAGGEVVVAVISSIGCKVLPLDGLVGFGLTGDDQLSFRIVQQAESHGIQLSFALVVDACASCLEFALAQRSFAGNLRRRRCLPIHGG